MNGLVLFSVVFHSINYCCSICSFSSLQKFKLPLGEQFVWYRKEKEK
jgi:hypothetical protein